MKDISMNNDDFLPLRDVVFNTLRNAILKGELEPGEKLMEKKLSEKLGGDDAEKKRRGGKHNRGRFDRCA